VLNRAESRRQRRAQALHRVQPGGWVAQAALRACVRNRLLHRHLVRTVGAALQQSAVRPCELSEVGYDWSPADLTLASRLITQALRPGAALVMVHCTPHGPDFPLTRDAVHEHFMGMGGEQRPLRHVHASRLTPYRLDAFERCSTPST
jgi:hypothetical protein